MKEYLRAVPGSRQLYHSYLRFHEQYRFLSRVARERYKRPAAIFDEYQEDYSHDAVPEQERYEFIVKALEKLCRNWGAAIEIGCSKGLFTSRLAKLCDSVLACDVSPSACRITATECAAFSNVKVSRLDVQRDQIDGEYDLVFVMDVLAYVHGRRRLELVINKLIGATRPGGILVFSDVRWPETIRNAWWQHWIPEGADAHLATISQCRNLRLIYSKIHRNCTDRQYFYIDHLIALYEKLQTPGRR